MIHVRGSVQQRDLLDCPRANPKLRRPEWVNPRGDLGIHWLAGWLFWLRAAVSGIGVSSRSKARRWSGVGSASMGTSLLVWW